MSLPAYTDDMNQIATYWSPGQNDGLGTITPGSAVVVACRWEDRASLVRGSDGREVASASVVYVDRPLVVEGWLALGDHSSEPDPRAAGARTIIQTGASPDLDATDQLYKVWL